MSTLQQPGTPGAPPALTRLVQEHRKGDALLRFSFGIVALVAALWLLQVDARPVPRITAALGALFGLLWVARFVRQRKAAESEELRLEPSGLTLCVPGKPQATVPWGDVERVELDEDALVVCVIRRGAAELRIEPGYGGLPLRELGEVVHDALVQHRTCIPTTDG